MGRIKKGMKNFSYLTAGNLISQAIGFIGFIYVAKILGPNYYGIYVTVGVFMGVFELVTFSGLHKVIIRKGSRDIEHMGEVLDDTIGIKSTFIFSAILIMVIASFFTNYETTTKIFIAIFSLKLFSKSFSNYFNSIYKVTEKMKYISFFYIFYRVVYVCLAVLMLSLGYGLFTLILISVFTSALEMVVKFLHSRKLINFNIFSELKFDRKILIPSLVFSAIGIVNIISTRVDLFMISFLGTPAEVGIYGVAYTFVGEGTLLRNLLATAFFPILIKTFDERSLDKRLLLKYSFFGIAVMVVLGVITFFYAEQVIVLIFGEEFRESGIILRILVFYLVSWWSTIPFTTAAQATNNEKVILIGFTIMAFLNIPLNFVLYSHYGLIGIAYSTIIVFTVGCVLINIYSYHLLKVQGHIH